MKVALYYPWIHLTSGAERVILEITTRSRHQYTIYTNHFDREATYPGFGELDVRELSRVSVDRSILNVVRAGWRIYRDEIPLTGYDALFVVCEGLGDLVALRHSEIPSICYCLTPLRVAFDTAYQARALAKRGLLGRLLIHAGVRAFRAIDRRAWQNYRSVVFISTEARKRASEGGLLQGVREELIWPGLGIMGNGVSDSQPYFLIAGRIMWTKNIELGITAFLLFQKQHPEYRLRIAGMVDAKSQGYLGELKALAQGNPQIDFVIAPSDSELRDLYANCYGLLFTPFNEDWGIVPLEAMSFGKPVIAVNQGGPVESIENASTGLLVPPNPEAFAKAMSDLILNPDLARRIGTAGAAAVQKYGWPAIVNRLDDIVEEVARGRNHSGVKAVS